MLEFSQFFLGSPIGVFVVVTIAVSLAVAKRLLKKAIKASTGDISGSEAEQ